MKFRLPPRPLDEAVFPRYLADLLDELGKAEPKPVPWSIRQQRIRDRLTWNHAEGRHEGWPMRMCPCCQTRFQEWAYALSAAWHPRDVSRFFR